MKTNSPLTVVKSPRGETRQSAADFGAKYPLSLALMLSALVVCAGMATPSAQAQDAATPQAAPAAGAAPADTQAPAEVAAPAATGESVALAPTNTATTLPSGGDTNGLSLNFRNAPIDLVLEQLSKSAGFIIDVVTPVRGNVTVLGQNLTKDEAVGLVNSELNRLGYAAIRTGRTLKIMDKATARTSNNPVKTGAIRAGWRITTRW